MTARLRAFVNSILPGPFALKVMGTLLCIGLLPTFIIALVRLRIWLMSRISQPKSVRKVVSLHSYPMKSASGITHSSAVAVNSWGLHNDRVFMAIRTAGDGSKRFFTQRQSGALATIRCYAIYNDGDRAIYRFHSDILPSSFGDLDITYPPLAAEVSNGSLDVHLWDDVVPCVDLGRDKSDWLTAVVDHFCCPDKGKPPLNNYGRIDLVALPHPATSPDAHRQWSRMPSAAYFPLAALDVFTSKPPRTTLCDGFPILIVGTASLRDLNERIQRSDPEHEPLTIDRFRGNIVVETTVPYEEDAWRVLCINGTIFHVLKACPRCKQSCTDQRTGVLDVEPERTLKTYRCLSAKNPTDFFFGQNVSCIGEGKLSVGDNVLVMETEDKFVCDKQYVRKE
jgi:uncharacterized protein YcbX